jgi:hypothetical protein
MVYAEVGVVVVPVADAIDGRAVATVDPADVRRPEITAARELTEGEAVACVRTFRAKINPAEIAAPRVVVGAVDGGGV